MNLHSAESYWPLKNGLLHAYPSLKNNIKTDVVVMGAGISGALAADALCSDGHDVVVVDKRDCGHGSTAASTALLQYEIDTPLRELIKKVGVDHAVRSYQLCLKSIEDLKHITKRFKDGADFNEKPSFQFTSTKAELVNHQEEMSLRRLHHISETTWLSADDIKKKFGFTKYGGILSVHGAEIDPFKLSHSLLNSSIKKNLRVYDNTEVVGIDDTKNGVTLKTDLGLEIKAKKLVIACGYESQKYIPKKIEIKKSTYAIISEVQEEKNHWYKNALIWETADPYIYLRITADNRILIGGRDDEFSDPKKRDQNISKKAKQLEKDFKKLFPHIPFRTDYQWGGTFCGTKDGLPYIGSIPTLKNTYFALGFGGNGITFSVIAAQIIADLVADRKNEDQEIFSFQRF